MKKLIFHFDQPKSTIIQVDNLTQFFSINSIENNLLFCEPKLFPTRLIQIINRENKSKKVFNEIIFVFNGELDQENSVLIRNKFLDQISYKDLYINYDLKKAFAPYIKSTKKIRLISHLNFYLGLKKQLNKNNYPSIIIHDGISVDVELAIENELLVNLNADIKEIKKLEDKTASEVLSFERLLKSVYGTKKDITNQYTFNLLEVIKFFKNLSSNKVKVVNSILIFTNPPELIKYSLLFDKLNIVVKVVDVNELMLSSKNKLVEANKRNYYSEDDPNFWDFIAQPIKNITDKFRNVANNMYVLVSEDEGRTGNYKKIEDSNAISTIYYYSANGDFIKEFMSFNAFQNYFDKNYDLIDEENYFEFYDKYDGYEVLTVRELKKTSILSNLKSKIERSLFG